MTTVVESTLGTGENYPGLQEWDTAADSAHSGNLVSADVIAKATITELLTYATVPTIAGSTSGRDNYKWITGERGSRWWEGGAPIRGQMSGPGLMPGTNLIAGPAINEAHCLIEDIRIVGNSLNAWTNNTLLQILAADVKARRLYVRNLSQSMGSDTALVLVSGARALLARSILSLDGPATSGLFVALGAGGGQATIDANAPTLLNVLGIRPSDKTTTDVRVVRRPAFSDSKMRMRGCVWLGVSNTFFGSGNSSTASWTADSDYNMVSAPAGSTPYVDLLPGSNNKYAADIPGGNWATAGVLLTNTTSGSGDFRPASGAVFDNVVGLTTTSPRHPDPADANPSNGPQIILGNEKDLFDTTVAANPTMGAIELLNENEIEGFGNSIGIGFSSAVSGGLRIRVGPLKVDGATVPDAGGLKWAFFDQATPDEFLAPTNKGTNASIVNGYCDLLIPNSSLARDDVGYFVLTNTTGDPDTAWKSFDGPVVVR